MAAARDTESDIKLAVLRSEFDNKARVCDSAHAELEARTETNRLGVSTNAASIRANKTEINRLRWFVAGVGASLSLVVGAITTLLGMLLAVRRLGWF